MPEFHFRERDSLGLGMRDFFEGLKFPEMNIQWFERDSLYRLDKQYSPISVIPHWTIPLGKKILDYFLFPAALTIVNYKTAWTVL